MSDSLSNDAQHFSSTFTTSQMRRRDNFEEIQMVTLEGTVR